jgi:predicted dehydrogenase
MTDLPKVGVIGTGRFGQNHVRIYKELPECQLIGLYDINIAQGMDVGAQYNVPVFPTAEALLDKVDMISVVTPTATHFDVATIPLTKGIKTFIEKPVSVTIEQADTLLRLAKENDTSISIGFLERFNPAFIAARQQLKNITTFRAERLGPWVGRKVTVDVVSDLMVHDLDLLNLIDSSPIVDLEAKGERIESDFYDRVEVTIKLESGLIANIVSDRASDRRFRELNFSSDSSRLRLDMIEQQFLQKSIDAENWQESEAVKAEPLKDELRAFVTGSSPAPADGLAGKAALHKVIAIQNAIG